MSRFALKIAPLLAVALIAGCAGTPEPAASDLEQARTIAAKVPASLLGMLQSAIQTGGPEGAIEVCSVKAPEMARAASEQTGWSIRRASLGNRNPKGAPDAWERKALERFDARVAAGEPPGGLEFHQVVVEDGRQFLRYAKALPTQALCVQCHGAPEALSGPVRTKLRELYPQDRAVGYATGQVRGGLFLKKAL